MGIDIGKELNRNQADAVLYTEGPQMVIAGAGSGKTRVLTYRIAHLLDIGVEPWSILALTFTNKAAREMKERIAQLVGAERAKYLWMGTFHSIFSRILHTEAQSIGFSSNFTVYDQSDSLSLIRSIIKEMQLDDKVYKPNVVLNRISNAKNRLVTPLEYQRNGDILKNDQFKHIGMCGQIYQNYWNRCHNADAMDFDDLLLYTYMLFRDNEAVLEKYAEKFSYVLVDEYQDTNFAQHSIVWQLTRSSRRICVVGDDAQSIYSFRGANIDNMLKFTKLYPEARIFKLEQNYRSTQTIVGAANSIIEKNRNQIRKNVFSENEKGSPIKLIQVQSDIAEANSVAENITSMHSLYGVEYGDIAILYRTNAQSRVFEETFRSNGIPYKIYGSLSFYQRKEIKDIIGYLRLVVNHNDEEAFKRVINTPARGIGQTTVGKIFDAALAADTGIWNVVSDPERYNLHFNSGFTEKISKFVKLINGLSEMSLSQDAYSVVLKVYDESGLKRDFMSDNTPEGQERLGNVQELLNGVDTFCRSRMELGADNVLLNDFLNEVSLMTDQDNEKEGDGMKVTLMTVHAAKGLEFDCVFIVGMEENLFPSQMCTDDPRQLEEERRLFYVALTRARKYCFLSFSRSRFIRGSLELSEPSRFLKEIDESYLDVHLMRSAVRAFPASESGGQSFSPFRQRMQTEYPADMGERHFERRTYSASTGFQPRTQAQPAEIHKERNLRRVSDIISGGSGNAGCGPAVPLNVGNIIDHERFGRGEVLSIEGSGDGKKARIRFENAGEKTLLLKFARFTVSG